MVEPSEQEEADLVVTNMSMDAEFLLNLQKDDHKENISNLEEHFIETGDINGIWC